MFKTSYVKFLVLFVVLGFCYGSAVSEPAFAKGPKHKKPNKGKGKDKSEDGVPPGIAKQGEKKVAKWKSAKAKAKKDMAQKMRERARKNRKSEAECDADAEKVSSSVEVAACAGVSVNKTCALVERALNRDVTAEDIKKVAGTIADIAKEGVDPDALADKAKALIEEGKKDAPKIGKALRDWVAQKVADKVNDK